MRTSKNTTSAKIQHIPGDGIYEKMAHLAKGGR